jgi:esterase/lipase superfamily enzyme
MAMKATERWFSERMQQDITLVRWGHFGVPVLLFPTAGGDAEEVERHKLVAHLQGLMEAGRIKVYSCDSVAGRAMASSVGSTQYRMALFNRFHEAMAYEVVPAIHADSQGAQPVITAGASIGAFNALALVCRYPHLFNAAVCMSGTYAIEKFIGGPFTDDMYLASPLAFLPGLEGPLLEQLRQRMVILASGSGAWEDVGESWAVARVLGDKGIPNRVDDWGPSYAHDWPTWWAMLPLYLDDLVP